MPLDTIDSLRQKAATQFGVMKACCYPDTAGNDITHTPDVVGGRTTAQTDGQRLTDLNTDRYQHSDIETRFAVLLHEVTHYEVSNTTRGKSSHAPEFWEAYQRNFNTIQNSQQTRVLVETVFGSGLDQFDWTRAKYRTIQNISQVDKRSETVDERKEKFAATINYDEFADFEDGDWGLWIHGRDDPPTHPDESCVRLRIGPQRFIDDYTVSTDEMIGLIQDNDGVCPMPLVRLSDNIDSDEQTTGTTVTSNGDWELAHPFRRQSRVALTIQERLGHGYVGVDIEAIRTTDDISSFSRASPVTIDQLSEVV